MLPHKVINYNVFWIASVIISFTIHEFQIHETKL